MGWAARAAGCAFLLLGATEAEAGGRIAYPSPGQMYVLLATDVRVTFGTTVPVLHSVAPPPTEPPVFALGPVRKDFVAPVSFERAIRHYAISGSIDQPPEILATNAESFRQDLFPEQQRARMSSPIDAMLTFSIGGSSSPYGNLHLEGGVAGALWRMSHPLTVTPASP